jgi:ribulose-phosphate 3-epimerase
MPSADTVRRLREAGPALSVGLLAGDLLHLGDELRRLEAAGARLVHFDVADGRFCPLLGPGPDLVRAVRTPMLKDVHLLIEEPLYWAQRLAEAGADVLTIQLESTPEPARVLRALAALRNVNDPDRGIVRGVAVKPDTPLAALAPLIGDLELVLVLGVDPGRGRELGLATLERVRALRALAGDEVLVGADGGVTAANAGELAAAGADLVVAGSAVFAGGAPERTIAAMAASLASRAPERPGAI